MTSRFRAVTFAILAAWHCLIVSPRASTADQPNILWITAEDMSATLGCYGDSFATTPNIDRLAKQSSRYTHAFATAPVRPNGGAAYGAYD